MINAVLWQHVSFCSLRSVCRARHTERVQLVLLVWTSSMVMLDISNNNVHVTMWPALVMCAQQCGSCLPSCAEHNTFFLSRLVRCHLVEVSHSAHFLHTDTYWSLQHLCKYGSCWSYLCAFVYELALVRKKKVTTAWQLCLGTFVFWLI
jgi:hypothetical protein